MAATIYDIAEKAGVSVFTVSRVLSGKHKSKRKDAIERGKKILAAAKELGYVPDDMARAIKTGKAKIIAIANSSPDDVYSATVNTQLAATLNELGYSLLPIDATNATHDPDEYDNIFKLCIKNRVSALIARGLIDQEYLRQLKEKLNDQGIELALLSHNAQVDNCIKVGSRDKKAMHEAVEYLYKLGHRNFLFIATDIHLYTHTQIRMEGFQEKVEDLGVSYRIMNVEKGRLSHGLAEIFSVPGKHPSAIVCSSDSYAVFTQSYLLYEYGIRCPQDYSIIGFGGKASADIYPKMTVIKEAHKKMAKNIACKVVAQLRGVDYGPKQEFFDDELVIGESTAPPPKNINHK